MPVVVLEASELEQLIERAVERAVGRAPRAGGGKELLSKRAAAKLLGVDRGTTLEEMIRDGRIRTVDVGGRVRVPRAELERILVAGVPKSEPRRRRSLRLKSPAGGTVDPGALRGANLSKL